LYQVLEIKLTDFDKKLRSRLIIRDLSK